MGLRMKGVGSSQKRNEVETISTFGSLTTVRDRHRSTEHSPLHKTPTHACLEHRRDLPPPQPLAFIFCAHPVTRSA